MGGTLLREFYLELELGLGLDAQQGVNRGRGGIHSADAEPEVQLQTRSSLWQEREERTLDEANSPSPFAERRHRARGPTTTPPFPCVCQIQRLLEEHCPLLLCLVSSLHSQIHTSVVDALLLLRLPSEGRSAATALVELGDI